MGVQPPSDGIDDGPDVVEFGIAALAAKIEARDVAFPIERDELLDQHGDLSVPVDAAGHDVTLRETVAQIDRERFDSQQELLDVLHPVFEAEREAVSRSILAQLRSLVPF